MSIPLCEFPVACAKDLVYIPLVENTVTKYIRTKGAAR